eukprot:TRINITY_DN2474_c0_g1_i2.p2 TRINITY_DN2474_c0_g1~~TRINITY_DN2474_c0_g1_i2.p2  ORF type:complete len:206 (+),score=63.27 TRINITY_DN2474_c0_g1_i2:187-804(+)
MLDKLRLHLLTPTAAVALTLALSLSALRAAVQLSRDTSDASVAERGLPGRVELLHRRLRESNGRLGKAACGRWRKLADRRRRAIVAQQLDATLQLLPYVSKDEALVLCWELADDATLRSATWLEELVAGLLAADVSTVPQPGELERLRLVRLRIGGGTLPVSDALDPTLNTDQKALLCGIVARVRLALLCHFADGVVTRVAGSSA